LPKGLPVKVRSGVKPATKAPLSTLPWGGRKLLPDYRLVALYGTPDAPALGVLGEQPVDAAISRAKDIAATYQPYSSEKVIPALEIIATIASATPTNDGDYSSELSAASFQPWIDAAQKAGVYVLLDLQPGRSDFLTQAKQYESLLAQPDVGLALDPEWRVGNDQVPLGTIGSVGVDEINQTADWLAGLITARHLPQKMFLVHQFRLDMVNGRAGLDTSHATELAYVIQMDGNGSQPQKQATWDTITADAPPGVSFGWKNFYDEDTPMLSLQQTMKQLPPPQYVSYQ
jgi:hypothetical protein